MNLKKSLSILLTSSFGLSLAACSGPQQNYIPDSGMSSDQTEVLAAKKYTVPSNLKNGEAIPGEFIIKYKSGVAKKNSLGGEVLKEIGGSKTGMQLVRVSTESKNTMTALKADSSIEWVEPNRIMKLDIIKSSGTIDSVMKGDALFNDPMIEKQYSHKITEADKAWSALLKGKKLETVVVAVVDTGVDVKHPDLKDITIPGYSAYPGEEPGEDEQGHGTHCAGIVGAIQNNKEGVAGVAGNVRIQPVKVLNNSGSGTYAAVADGISWAGQNGAKVLSMSLGGPSSSQAISDAVELAMKNGAIVIAAMGNSGPTAGPSFPAAVKGVLGVGATDSADKIANFSQTGTHNSVAAPGVNILSTFPQYANGIGQMNYGSISGTSMACPYVAGLAGMIRGLHPEFTAAQVRDRLEKTADDKGAAGYDKVFGFGRVNVAKALAN